MTKKVNIIKKATLSILAVLLAAISFAVIGETVLADAACSHSPATRTTAATCTASGKRQTYCRICGKVLSTSYTSALGHSYSSATCTSARRCTRCGATSGSALGHSYSSATCTSARRCTRCGATSGSALGHSYSSATCTSARRCTRCGATSGSALGHSYSSATCTSAKKCTRCGATSGSALGHNYLITRSATCGAAGIKACSRCSATQTIAATGNHSPATRISKAATCEVTGTRQTYCTTCNNTLSTATIAALGHSYSAATCTSAKKCTRCGGTSGSALGHSYLNATCSAPKRCSRCNYTVGNGLGHDYQFTSCTTARKCSRCAATSTIPGHQMIAPTCTTSGKCSVCGLTGAGALGHEYGQGTCISPAKCLHAGCTSERKVACQYSAATCTSAKKCKVCGGTEGTALGHDYAEATCSQPKTCKRCNNTIGNGLGHDWRFTSCTTAKKCARCSALGEIPNHVWKDPTCTENTTCTVCGFEVTGSKLSHLMSNGSCTVVSHCTRAGCTYEDSTTGHCLWTPATCSAPERCTRCNATRGNGLGHIMTGGSCTESAYCTREGCTYKDPLIEGHDYTRTYCTEDMKCTKCGAVATGSKEFCHALVVVTDATCTADGLKKCSNPNCPYTEIIEGGHNIVPAVCSAPERCTRCNATWGNGLGHVMTGGSCTEPAYCTREGCNYKDSLVEGHSYTRNLCTENLKCEKCGTVASGSWESGHTMFVEKEATCTTDGLKKCVHESCSYEEVIPAGHDKIPATCTNPSYCGRCLVKLGDSKGGHKFDESKCNVESLQGSSETVCKVWQGQCKECGETVRQVIPHQFDSEGYCQCGRAKYMYNSIDIRTNENAPVKVEIQGNVIKLKVNLILDDNSEAYRKYIEEAIKKWEGDFKRSGQEYEIKIDEISCDMSKNGVTFVVDDEQYLASETRTEGGWWDPNESKTIYIRQDITSCANEKMIINILAHEFGHVLGAGEAYENVGENGGQNLGGVPENSIMGVSGTHNEVTDFDMNLVIDALESGREADIF